MSDVATLQLRMESCGRDYLSIRRFPPVLLWRPAEDSFGLEEDSDVMSADFRDEPSA